MKRACFGLLALLAAAVPLSTVACDGSDETVRGHDDDAGSDAAVPPDASDDDAADADADAEAPEPCTEDGFCHTELPGELVLRDVWGDGTGIVWAVSEGGDILRWDGSAWTIQHSEPGELFAIWGGSPTDVWAGGERRLFHGEGASSNALVWTHVDVPGLDGIPITSIWGSSSSDVWAVAGRSDMMLFPPVVEGRALHFGGKATGWTVQPVRTRDASFTKVWGTGPRDVWIGGFDLESFPLRFGDGLVFRLDPDDDSGTSFIEVALPELERPGGRRKVERVLGGATIGGDLIVLASSEDAAAYLVGSTEQDGGATLSWRDETFAVHPSHHHHAVWGSASNDLWLAGEYGRLRHWDGATWYLPRISTARIPVTNDIHAIWAQGTNDVWFVGDRIALHKRPSKAK